MARHSEIREATVYPEPEIDGWPGYIYTIVNLWGVAVTDVFEPSGDEVN